MEELGQQNKPLNYKVMGILKKLAKAKGDKRTLYAYHRRLDVPKSNVYHFDNNPENITLGFLNEFLQEIGSDWIEAAPVIADVLAKSSSRNKKSSKE